MCPGSEQYERVCKAEFAEINTKLDRLDEALRGNGKPGVMTRLDRLERSAAAAARTRWLAIGAAVTLAAGTVWQRIFGG